MTVSEGIFQNIISIDAAADIRVLAGGQLANQMNIYDVKNWLKVKTLSIGTVGRTSNPPAEGDRDVLSSGDGVVFLNNLGPMTMDLSTGVWSQVATGFSSYTGRIVGSQGLKWAAFNGIDIGYNYDGITKTATHDIYNVNMPKSELDIVGDNVFNNLFFGYNEDHWIEANANMLTDEKPANGGRLIAGTGSDGLVVVEPLKLFNTDVFGTTEYPAFFGMYITVFSRSGDNNFYAQYQENYRYPLSIQSNNNYIRVGADEYIRDGDEYTRTGATEILLNVSAGGVITKIGEGDSLESKLSQGTSGWAVTKTVRHIYGNKLIHFMQETNAYPRAENIIVIQDFITGNIVKWFYLKKDTDGPAYVDNVTSCIIKDGIMYHTRKTYQLHSSIEATDLTAGTTTTISSSDYNYSKWALIFN